MGRAVSAKSDPRYFDREEFDRFDREEFDRFDREEFDRDLERGVEGEFVQPALFRPDISLGLDGQYWLADEPAYNSLVQGGRATLTRRIGDEASLTLTAGSPYQCTEIAAAALADPDLRIETAPLDLARLGRLAPALADCALAPTLTARLEAARSPHAAFEVDTGAGDLDGNVTLDLQAPEQRVQGDIRAADVNLAAYRRGRARRSTSRRRRRWT